MISLATAYVCWILCVMLPGLVCGVIVVVFVVVVVVVVVAVGFVCYLNEIQV